MSMILIKTEQDYKIPNVVAGFVTAKPFALAIDVSSFIPLKQKLTRNLVVKALQQISKDHLGFVDNIETQDLPYSGGCLYLIDFNSPVLDVEEIPKYQHFLKSCLEGFNPSVVDRETLDAVQNSIWEEVLQDKLLHIENDIFKAPREHVLISDSVQKAMENKDKSVPKKKI